MDPRLLVSSHMASTDARHDWSSLTWRHSDVISALALASNQTKSQVEALLRDVAAFAAVTALQCLRQEQTAAGAKHIDS